jgi:hypothetical protein
MALVLVHLHAKRGEGLSNQLRQSKSMSPDYSVRWWKNAKMQAPEIDIERFFEKKLEWRYAKGIPIIRTWAQVRLGDARRILPQLEIQHADLLFTSPPYFGVTNYEYDNWIRLWMLGDPALPSYRAASRFGNAAGYDALLRRTFDQARKHCKRQATIYVRADARSFTRHTTESILRETWPRHSLFFKYDRAMGATQTSLFQDSWHQAGEVDFLLLSEGHAPPGFHRLS